MTGTGGVLCIAVLQTKTKKKEKYKKLQKNGLKKKTKNKKTAMLAMACCVSAGIVVDFVVADDDGCEEAPATSVGVLATKLYSNTK